MGDVQSRFDNSFAGFLSVLFSLKCKIINAWSLWLLLKDRIFFCGWFQRIWIVLYLLFQKPFIHGQKLFEFWGSMEAYTHTTEENRDKINITKRKNSLQMSQWYLSCHSRTVCHFWIRNRIICETYFPKDRLRKLLSKTNLPLKMFKRCIYTHYLCLTFSMSSTAYCLGWKILGPYFRVIYTFPQRLKSSLLQIEPWLRIMKICFLPTI